MICAIVDILKGPLRPSSDECRPTARVIEAWIVCKSPSRRIPALRYGDDDKIDGVLRHEMRRKKLGKT